MDDQNKGQATGRRFRLPKLFADHADTAEPAEVEESEEQEPNEAAPPRPARRATSSSGPASVESIAEEIEQLRGGLESIYQLVTEMNQRESTQEKVFNTLHGELRDYKNDFIYEHLKPVIRPLLFLYDSLEQFGDELAAHERPGGDERRSAVSPRLVKENVSYFKEQLVESLRICEVTLMEEPEGAFNAKLHKAVEVEPVPAELDNIIIKVIRAGWYLNGQLFRPAEVVIGRKQA